MELRQPVLLQCHIQHFCGTGIESIYLLCQFADTMVKHDLLNQKKQTEYG
jgi:hypothetical protein